MQIKLKKKSTVRGESHRSGTVLDLDPQTAEHLIRIKHAAAHIERVDGEETNGN